MTSRRSTIWAQALAAALILYGTVGFVLDAFVEGDDAALANGTLDARFAYAGVDRSVIALFLGHESIQTTQIYLDADLSLKERARARTAPLRCPGPNRYRAPDALIAFLEAL